MSEDRELGHRPTSANGNVVPLLTDQRAAKTKATAKAVSAIVRHTGFPTVEQSVLLADPSIQKLLEMLSYMRPAGSLPEEEFIATYLVPTGAHTDDYGNYWLVVGDAPDIIWSSHTDTVHTKAGSQVVTVGDGMVWAENSSCLGADDTAGIWLMLEMIKAGVPGTYIFHREEECGGHGSTYINKHYKEVVSGYKAAIAFDRKGYGDVITHQMRDRCCSDDFAESLAAILGGAFMPDDSGVFTDTQNYTDNVGECTNISVGYHMAHGPNECLDLSFLSRLRDVLVNADWSKLVFTRKPGEIDYAGSGGGWSSNWKRDYDGYGYGGTRSKWTGYEDRRGPTYDRYEVLAEDDDLDEMEDYCRKYAERVAVYLRYHGIADTDIDDWHFDQLFSKRKRKRDDRDDADEDEGDGK